MEPDPTSRPGGPAAANDAPTVPPLGIYIHVPFCAARCGYCDFNTYVPRGAGQPEAFLDAALAEIDLARAELGDRRVATVFIGGGTPTLLAPVQLIALLERIRERFGLEPGAEVTTEANPESVDPSALAELRAGGFTRISLGMQSAAPHVLRTLERVHSPGRAVAAAIEARAAGFDHVSVDLIYGTPGESDADLLHSLEAALSAGPDHLSAYALEIHPGTAMGAALRRGTIAAPDDDAAARRFELLDDQLQAAGLDWYELASWARDETARCRHNLGYWRGADWWGIGPGAHSHLDGVRWSNVLAPAAYARRLAEGRSPAAQRELLSPGERQLETIMLGLRTRDGLELTHLDADGRRAAEAQAALGRLTIDEGRIRLTRRGRLFADAVARELSPPVLA